MRGVKVGSGVGVSKEKKKFKCKIGQNNVVTRYTGGTNGDLSAWVPL